MFPQSLQNLFGGARLSNFACGMLEVCDGDSLQQWSRVKILLTLVNHSTKTMHHHHPLLTTFAERFYHGHLMGSKIHLWSVFLNIYSLSNPCLSQIIWGNQISGNNNFMQNTPSSLPPLKTIFAISQPLMYNEWFFLFGNKMFCYKDRFLCFWLIQKLQNLWCHKTHDCTLKVTLSFVS